MIHHAHSQGQHHGGGGGVADPHGQEGGYGKQHQNRHFHIASGNTQEANGDFTVETLHVQCGGKREAAEEDVNRRVGKARHRFFDVRIGEAEYDGENRHHQCSYRDVDGFGKPKRGNENQQRDAFVGIGTVRQDVIDAETDDGGNNRRQQAFKVGNRRLCTEQLDILRMLGFVF